MNIKATNVVIPKGTKITFTGESGRVYTGILAKPYSTWRLNKSNKLRLTDTPVLTPEKRKKIDVGFYVKFDNLILRITEGYTLIKEKSFFKGVAVYAKDIDGKWVEITNSMFYAKAELSYHHSKIHRVFKTIEKLQEYLMMENI